MNAQKLEELLHHKHIFSLQELSVVAPDFRPNTLTARVQKGKLLRIKRGRYMFSHYKKEEGVRAYVSNQIMTPSYLSLEWALGYYQLIPEGVTITTSITTKKTTSYSTPIGLISYKHVKPALFWGYEITQAGKYEYLIACPEKTILDYLYLHPEMNSEDAFDEWRVDVHLLQELWDTDLFLSYIKRYDNQQLQKRAHLFHQRATQG